MTYTPGGGSAYGPTAEITRLHQLDLNQELILGANPWMANDPDTLMRLATSGANPLDLVNNAGAMAGMEKIDSLGRAMSTMDEIGQRAAYAKLTEQQQRALANTGYAPPQRQEGGGFISDVFNVTGEVLGTALRPVGSVLGPVLGPAMDMLTWIGDVPTHFYRAIRQMEGWQQWLALGVAAAAVAATGGLALAAGAGVIGAGGALGAAGAGAASLLGGAASMGTLATLGTLGGIGLGAGIAATAPTLVTNPTEWWDLMNPFDAGGVGKGEQVFTRQGQKRAFQILGGAEHLHALARDFAVEMSIEDLALEFAGVRDAAGFDVMTASVERVAKSMVDPGTPEYQRVFEGLSKLIQQPEFQEAVSELQSSKISPGRDLAGALGKEPGDFGFGLISGSVDALWLLTMDPTLALGKIGKLQQLTRRGLDTPSGVDAVQRLGRMVNEDPAVGAVANQIARAIEVEDFTQMPAAWRTLFMPMLEYKRGMATANTASRTFEVPEFMEYIAHGAGLKEIMRGKGTIRGIEQIVISAQSKDKGWGRFVESVRQFQHGLTDPILIDDAQRMAKQYGVETEFLKWLPANLMDEAVDTGFTYRKIDDIPINETWGYRSGKAVGTGLLYIPGGRSLGNFISGISTMIPANSALSLVGDDAHVDIPRFVEAMGRHMNMPSGYRDEWLNTIMRQGSVDERRAALLSFTDSIFTAGGFKSTDEWATLTDKYMRHYEQAYALGGLDILDNVRNADGTRVVRGIYPELHQAVYMVMPNLREMSHLVRQGHFLKHVAKITDSNFAEQAMSRVVKPGWLMRIGFIPRAAGEEMLAFWLRMSEGGLTQEFAARTVAKRNLYHEARAELVANGGKINELNAVHRAAIENRFPTHLKPLVAMSRRLGWQSADEHLLDRYLDWSAEIRRSGMGIELPETMPEWTKVLIAGREGSIRRMVLNGVDRELVEAGELWIGRHADSIMRATSSLNASLFERNVVSPNAGHMVSVVDPNDSSKRIEVMVPLSGERIRVGADDPRHAAGVHHRAQEPLVDRITKPIVANAFTIKYPKASGVMTKANVADALQNVGVVDSWASKMIVLTAMGNPRPDNMRALATQLREVNMVPEAEVIEALVRANNFSGQAIAAGLAERAAAIRALNDPVQLGELSRVEQLQARIEQVAPTLDGFAALNPDEANWLAAVLTRQIANDHQIWDPATVRTWATWDADTPIPKAPTRKFYRGVPNDRTWRMDDNGDLILVAQEQGHFRGGKAISLTMEPQQAMVYASSGVDSGVDSAYLTGVVFEIDGDYILETGGRTIEELMAEPLTFYDGYKTENGGLYLIGMGGGEQATEITWYTGNATNKAIITQDYSPEEIEQFKTYRQWLDDTEFDPENAEAWVQEAWSQAPSNYQTRMAAVYGPNGVDADAVRQLIDAEKSHIDWMFDSSGPIGPNSPQVIELREALERYVRTQDESMLFSAIDGIDSRLGGQVEEVRNSLNWLGAVEPDEGTDALAFARQQLDDEVSNLLGSLDSIDIPAAKGTTMPEELRIPAGKFRMMNHDDMKTIVDDSFQRDRTKFTNRVQRLNDNIAGYTPEEIMWDLDLSLDDMLGSLTPDELDELSQLIEMPGLSANTFGDEAESFIDDLFAGAAWDFDLNDRRLANVGDFVNQLSVPDISSGLRNKLTGWMSEEIEEGVTRFDLFIALRGDVTESSIATSHLLRGRVADRLGATAAQRPAEDVLGGLFATNRARGQGAFMTPAGQFPGWAPFIEDNAEWEKYLVNELTAHMHRPENLQWTRQQQLITHDAEGRAVARPPEEGVARIYSPVSPINTSNIEALLDGREYAQNAGVPTQLIDRYRSLQVAGKARPDNAEFRSLISEFYVELSNSNRGLGAPVFGGNSEIADMVDTIAYYIKINVDPSLVEAEIATLGDLLRGTDSSYNELAAKLLGQNRQNHWTDRFIDQMTEEEKIDIIGRVLADWDASRAKYALKMSMPIDSVAFDDPRIAKWVSSVLADANSADPFRVGQLDVPRNSLVDQGAGKDGVRLANAYDRDMGRMWETDARYIGMHTPLDAPAFQHVQQRFINPLTNKMETSWAVVPGVSMETAYADASARITENILQNWRRGVREVHTFRGPVKVNKPKDTLGEAITDTAKQLRRGKDEVVRDVEALPDYEQTVARRVGNKYVPLEPGEQISMPEDFYLVDAKNRVLGPVNYGSNAWFDQTINEQSDELMMSLVGPMVRDVFEEDAGLARKTAKDFRERKGRFGQTNKPVPTETELEASTDIVMTHSRLSDVALEPSAALPNVAIVRDYGQMNNRIWDRIVRYGFDNVIGPAIDALARKPMSFHYFAAAYKQQKRNLSWCLDTDLFEVQFAREFSDVLAALDGEVNLPDELIDDARLVAQQAFGVDLGTASPDEVKKFLVSMSNDHEHFVSELDSVVNEFGNRAMAASAARSPYTDPDSLSEFVTRYADSEPEAQVRYAAERLRDRVNRNALSISIANEGVGGRTPAERLVSAYHEAVPEGIWQLGDEAVKTYLREWVPGLPHDFSRDQWRVLKSARDNLDHIIRESSDIAAVRAMENVIPYLDSHEQRSMFAEYGRNFLPFWYAEENFIKRWSRTLSLGQFGTPWGAPIPSGGLDKLRKAQLTYMGIKSVGIIRTDVNGDDWVVYPGSGLLMEATAKILPGDVLPIGVLFQAQTDSLLPGMSLEGNVGPSPFIAAPAQFIGHLFPEAAGIRRGLLGDIGSQRNALSQFVPTVISNAWVAAFGDENSQQRYASAMMSAIAFMEARGDGLAEGATAADIDEYLDKVRQHARIVMASQVLAGFVSPGAPSAIATGADGDNWLTGFGIDDPKQLTSTAYQRMVQALGVEKGTEEFLATFPMADLEDVINPFAFTQSMSSSVSGAPLPATEKGMAWYLDNQGWVDQLPEAGAWLIPPADENADFDFYSYSQQVSTGLRKRKTPQEYLTAIKYRQGADRYFEAKDAYEAALLQVGGDQAIKASLDDAWGVWKSQYLAAHPIFAEELLSGDARQRRARTITQMRNAVGDPSAPDSPHAAGIKEMVEAFDHYEASRKLLSDRRDAESREKLRQLKAMFGDWAAAWQLQYPQISRLWDSVYRPESNID